MCYKACTPDDISFLHSRISSQIGGWPSVNEKQFHNVSVITTLNLPKDVINDLGSQRFTEETGQVLINFYSEDSVTTSNTQGKKTIKKNTTAINLRKKVQVPMLLPALQQIIWDLPPSSNTKNIPGKLSLCRGLPVIIRLNSATELCMTKGQDATVFDWQTTRGSKGQIMLDTLFVKFLNPPQTVQLDNLSENVVPLTRTITNTQCLLPNDETINISRSQVEVLPNFAMTDYTSQGKTRMFNVVLRQEFRELEMLNDITMLRYNKKLPSSVVGVCRNDVISAFRFVKGDKYSGSQNHPNVLLFGQKCLV